MAEEARLELQCSACGIAAFEQEVRTGARFESVEALRGALRGWAREEGHDSADEFAEASFLDGRVDRIYERIRDGERVETNFDVLAFLFPEMAIAAAMPGPERGSEEGERREAPKRDVPTETVGTRSLAETGPKPEPEPEPEERRGAPEEDVPTETVGTRTRVSDELRNKAWAPLLPLVSVMVADGRVHPAEEKFLRRFLDANRCPPIPADFVRVHRPEAVPRPPDARGRERLVEAMVHLVHVDRQRDGSEFRVVEEYARAWGVDPGKVLHWDNLYKRRYATGLRRLWLILQSAMTRT